MSDRATTLLEVDFGDGAYGPTLLLIAQPGDGIRWLHGLLRGLAESPEGTAVRVVPQPLVWTSEDVTEIRLCVVTRSPVRHLQHDRAGSFVWSATAEEWTTATLLVEPLLHQPGHQYLTSETEDDALVEISVGERHKRQAPASSPHPATKQSPP